MNTATAVKRSTLLKRLWQIQDEKGFLPDEDIQYLAKEMNCSQIELEGIISFYHFFHRKPAGKFTVYLNNSIIADFKGFDRVKKAFEQQTSNRFGTNEGSNDFGLFETPCIGLSDQEPAALINFYPFTHLNTLKVKNIVAQLKQGATPAEICDEVPDLIRSVPEEDKAIFFRPYHAGSALKSMVKLNRPEVIDLVEQAKLTGMGGAFFPTAIKWRSCAQQESKTKYIVCNADEGEPGTFKDRALLSARTGLVLEGMIVAGYATGAREGILYLRGEYRWLLPKIEAEITRFREQGWLGEKILEKEGFTFNIRVELGAGSYVVGAETAMLNSMEGKRGEPRTRLFFPTERGFLSCPTVVNNVETLCAAARIMELGLSFMEKTGTKKYDGTKLLSVSGDCQFPGIYEVEWGTSLRSVLNQCGADDPYYVQISGPAGNAVPRNEFHRLITPDDLACNGSLMIFNRSRDLLHIFQNYNRFFQKESCGVCTPCRAGNFIVGKRLQKIADGLATPGDIQELHDWDQILKMTSRCGLGKTATTALVEAIEKFPELREMVAEDHSGLFKQFDLDAATTDYEQFKP